ncbi:PSP1 domain-containing protein [Parapedobacter lycopersici]|uniref:PSP1 domain-containing protein n=1 Tax=Parapedobacter lycopersici TaxID=1864939 RepID=UPI00214DB88C|nr:regulatory iron-sulfur-containing complex subunit RicT [Parapedobacter lycopersici]
MTSGCNKLDVYDWLSDMDLPTNYTPFNIVEVRFKGSRKDFYINHENLYLEMGELVAVEPATGGYDLGHVSMTGELVRLQLKKNKVDTTTVAKKIYRKANDADLKKWQAAKDLEWETMHRARKLALDLGLSMKISDVDYQGDKTKATFYYTAEGRVDFRELIKRMAEEFRIRIEMRQIGMRQEASRLGGIGSCGRELCCSTWLTDFKTVSTAAARYQNLSLNTLKLAGQCGKLKCCLNYELDSYMDALKDFPRNIERIETQLGTAYLQKTDIFKKLMWFSYPGEENWIALTTTRVKEISQLNKEGIKPEELGVVLKESAEEKPVVYDYENVVGQDSLTRLDERNKKKRKSGKGKRRTDGKKNENAKPQQQRQPSGSPDAPAQPAKPSRPTQAASTGEEAKPKKPKRRFRGNNNKKGKPGGPPNKEA